MTELSTLERKPLSDLHQIAAQLGIEQYRKYRKPQLAELIYKTATEQAVGQPAAEATPNGGETAAPTITPETGTNGNGETTPVAPEEVTEARPDPFGEADTAIATPEEVEQRRQQQRGRDKGADRQSEQRRDGRRDKGERQDGRQDGRQQEGQGQSGILDVLPDGFGFLRTTGYSQGKGDVYVSTSQIKRFNLRRGDYVVGQIRPARDGEKYPALVRIESVNGYEPQKGRYRTNFDDLTPLYPMERLRLEWKPNDLAPRVIDLVAPIGKGQRGLIVSPPKAGKTTILKQVAQSIAANYPEAKLFVLLADERPEEVTDWERSVEEATVVSSTFDQPADNHIAVAELVLERVKRLVEEGEDVVVLLDIENGGSLTIIASALVETGSRMDEVIYEEFKGTGNMEIHLERKLANKRIYPAINIEDSGTRKEELLMEPAEAQRVWQVRSILGALDSNQKLELLIQKLKETRTNAEFLRELQRVRS
jgi:transcription termination factor Rho